MSTHVIHTALVEDDAEIRQLLQLIVDNSPGFSCQYAFPDAEQALAALPDIHVDVVLMDIELPGMTGIECVGKLKTISPETDVIMLSVRAEDDAIFDSLCAGASGYLVKETPPAALLDAIRECFNGGSPMSAQIARRVVRSFHRPQQPSPLSDRETEVLRMLCDGANYKSIAEALFVSANTVKAHIKNIYKKLHVHSRGEAVSKAHRDGLI